MSQGPSGPPGSASHTWKLDHMWILIHPFSLNTFRSEAMTALLIRRDCHMTVVL